MTSSCPAPQQLQVGWTVGAGVEYAITNNITVKGEYLLLQPWQHQLPVDRHGPFATAFPGVVATTKYTFDGSIIRTSMNYKF